MTLPRMSRSPLRSIALAAASFAALSVAAPALAQAVPVPVNKQMAGPMNEGVKAYNAKDFVTAKAKYEAGLALAKTPQEILTAQQSLLAVAEAAKDHAGKIKAIEGALATNLLAGEDAKRYKLGLAGAYLDAGDQAKALVLSRAYIDEFGGTPQQYIAIANDAIKNNDMATGITYAEKAIAGSKTAGQKPPESYYKLLMRGYMNSQQPDKYIEAFGRLIADYPQENYWREYITNAVKEPGYKAVQKSMQFDLYRALSTAGVKLNGAEKGSMANAALDRGLPNEAVQILEPAIAAGEVGAAGQVNAAADQKNLKDAQAAVKSEQAGLAAEEKEVLAKGTGTRLASFGELQMSYGDYPKAIEFFQKGLDKGIADPGEADLVRLHMGIAQYKAGNKDAAKATWAQIKTTDGSNVLARSWTLIANTR